LILSPCFLTFMEPRNRYQGMNSASLCSLAGRYDNPIPSRFLAPIDCLQIQALYSGSVGQRLRDDGNLHSLTLSSKINGYLYPQRVSPRLKNNYLCTYNLYGPVRNAFDAGSIRYMGKWEGVGAGYREFFGPCDLASTDRQVSFGAQKTRD
jgi:hypothetical protein